MAMVELLLSVRDIYGIGIIDLCTDKEFNDVREKELSFYIADDIHPTSVGYLKCRTPKTESYLCDFVETHM